MLEAKKKVLLFIYCTGHGSIQKRDYNTILYDIFGEEILIGQKLKEMSKI